MTTKQDKLYKKLLLEIYNSGLDLKAKGYLFKSLKLTKGDLKTKIKAYHLFFKTFGSFPKNKTWEQLNNQDFNIYLESIRIILSDNKYVLKVDEYVFNNTLNESKKTLDFFYFIKRG